MYHISDTLEVRPFNVVFITTEYSREFSYTEKGRADGDNNYNLVYQSKYIARLGGLQHIEHRKDDKKDKPYKEGYRPHKTRCRGICLRTI